MPNKENNLVNNKERVHEEMLPEETYTQEGPTVVAAYTPEDLEYDGLAIGHAEKGGQSTGNLMGSLGQQDNSLDNQGAIASNSGGGDLSSAGLAGLENVGDGQLGAIVGEENDGESSSDLSSIRDVTGGGDDAGDSDAGLGGIQNEESGDGGTLQGGNGGNDLSNVGATNEPSTEDILREVGANNKEEEVKNALKQIDGTNEMLKALSALNEVKSTQAGATETTASGLAGIKNGSGDGELSATNGPAQDLTTAGGGSGELGQANENTSTTENTTESTVGEESAQESQLQDGAEDLMNILGGGQTEAQSAEELQKEQKKAEGRSLGLDVGRSKGLGKAVITSNTGEVVIHSFTKEDNTPNPLTLEGVGTYHTLEEYIDAKKAIAEAEESFDFKAGFYPGYNEGYMECLRLKKEAAKTAEESDPKYAEGKAKGTELAARSVNGEDINAAKKTAQENADVKYRTGFNVGYNEGIMAARRAKRQAEGAAEAALQDDPNYAKGYDLGHEIGMAMGQFRRPPEGMSVDEMNAIKEKANENKDRNGQQLSEQYGKGFTSGYNKGIQDGWKAKSAARAAA